MFMRPKLSHLDFTDLYVCKVRHQRGVFTFVYLYFPKNLRFKCTLGKLDLLHNKYKVTHCLANATGKETLFKPAEQTCQYRELEL